MSLRSSALAFIMPSVSLLNVAIDYAMRWCRLTHPHAPWLFSVSPVHCFLAFRRQLEKVQSSISMLVSTAVTP
ncbi:hypothetical protein EDB19DRAFT_1765829 [Suillus lakei]|nr:hypothetical protein EDB19DRAFT_1765829 [Suillus lakei]